MRVGYRVVSAAEVGLWEGDLVQISAYRGMRDPVGRVRKLARACRDAGLAFVVHPVNFSLLDGEALGDLLAMAGEADEALILHDERSPDGGRLTGSHAGLFHRAVEELSSLAPLSFENAINTADAPWFWRTFADSVTLDIGHVEAAGIDAVAFVHDLEEDVVRNIRYVHMHRNGDFRGGLTDHWPLRGNCREIQALRELLTRAPDVAAILEVNETEEMARSIELLKELA